MSYTVLARRYRSQTFEEIVGQEAVAKTLRGAIESGRVAHAYLFTGSRGVGKTSTARILAKALNCTASEKPTVTPCNACDVCRAVSVGEDVDVIEIDGASNNGVEQVRELRQNAIFKPARARYKVYIIDEVHMLSGAAFNALLKTLEEPPPHVKFIFATTEANKLPITVRSRCQRFDFRNIATPKIADNLRAICKAEGVEIDETAVLHVARAGAGSMRDAVSLLEQLLSVGEKKVGAELVAAILGTPPAEQVAGLFDAITGKDPATALKRVAELLGGGMGPEGLAEGMLDYLRTMLITSVAGVQSELLEVGPETAARAHAHARQSTPAAVTQMMSLVSELQRNVRRNSAARALVDAAVWELCHFDQLVSVADVLGGLPVTPAPAAGTAARPAAPAVASGAPVRPTVVSASPAPAVAAAAQKKTEPPAVTGTPAAMPPAPRPSPTAPVPHSGNGHHAPAAAAPAVAVALPPAPAATNAQFPFWPQLVAHLESLQKPGLASCLERGRPVAMEEGCLVVEMSAAFDQKLCEGKAERESIVQALEAVGAGRIGVKFRLPADGRPADASADGKGPARITRQEVASVLNDPLIAQAMELFGGRLVNIEKEE